MSNDALRSNPRFKRISVGEDNRKFRYRGIIWMEDGLQTAETTSKYEDGEVSNVSSDQCPGLCPKTPEKNAVNDKQSGNLTDRNVSKTMAGARKKSFWKQQEGPSVSKSKNF
ncbi:hypothetical protein BELL_0020g00120 [Botrytis elliptica]|uniref:Uncharacterized protein n=1 Tax=Botrytis elliptica TaxID=278938 RepID=A0A4Z1K1X8_9HELO|nr:hypothetical protein BELL_0020g00120 [Botrytis elliptica]